MDNMTDQEITTLLDVIVKNEYTKFRNAICDSGAKIILVEFELAIPVDDDFYNKSGLSKEITFNLHCDERKNKIVYKYCGVKLDPNCYFLSEESHNKPTWVQIAKAAIEQKTNRPDIRSLQDGNKENKNVTNRFNIL